MSKQASRQRAGKQRPAPRARAQQPPAQRSPAQRPPGRRTGGRYGRGQRGYAGMRRTRRQRIGITVVAVAGLAALWVAAALGELDVGLAIAMSVLLLVGLPAFVVLAIGRRY